MRTHRLTLWAVLAAVTAALSATMAWQPTAGTAPIPEPVPPVYPTLKDLNLKTPLVADGDALAAILVPGSGAYDEDAVGIQQAIRAATGARVPIVTDVSQAATLPIERHLIALGNRSTNALISRLYDLYYCILDLKYPGPGGYNVRTLHNPFGNGRNIVLLGGSDSAGVTAASDAFVRILARTSSSPGNLTVGVLNEIRLSPGLRIDDPKHWDDGQQGSYGWNAVSDRMALYYMTGRERYAREMLRYAFPDDATRQELQKIEFIDYRDSPLAESADYQSHLMVVFWDLIEESPVFSDAERLEVTNALARQLNRLRNEAVYDMTPGTKVENDNMHASYSALGLHTLGRYFARDYPDPIWTQCLRAAWLYYTSLHEDAEFAVGTDNLEWYNTQIQPVLTYVLLAGWREPVESGAVARLMRSLEALMSGVPGDANLEWGSLGLFNKAAYLLQDGRWAWYRDLAGLDTDVFRLGQSFWPVERLAPAAPADLVARWTIYDMPEVHRRARRSGVEPGEAFYFGSFRSAVDGAGDFILIDGYNGEGRNPYHTFTVSELRLGGQTVLQGYRNQVLVSADGVMTPQFAMDAALRHRSVVGDIAIAVAEVPQMAWADWRRTLAQRTGRYVVFADEITFRTSSENMAVETLWEVAGHEWRADEADWSTLDRPPANAPARTQAWHPDGSFLEVATDPDRSRVFEIHMSDVLEYRGDPVPRLGWHGPAAEGERRVQFSLIGPSPANGGSLACLRIDTNAAALWLPQAQAALAATGRYGSTDAALALIAEDHMFGHGVTSAGVHKPLVDATRPVEVSWDFSTGVLHLVAPAVTEISLRGAFRALHGMGGPVSVTVADSRTRFRVPAGRHRITGAVPNPAHLSTLKRELRSLVARGRTARTEDAAASADARPIPDDRPWLPAFTARIGAVPTDIEIGGAPNRPVIYVSAGPQVHRLTPDGRTLPPFMADDGLRVLHWWPEPRLLLAGSSAGRVLAFDAQGTPRWTFDVEYDPTFYGPGDDGPFTWLMYWPDLTGIHGLYSTVFLNGRAQAFVGSTNTLDILDERGRHMKRLPVLRGMVHGFAAFGGEDGRRTLLLAREPSDWDTLTVIDNATLTPEPEGFHDLPPGHQVTWAWMQNRPVYLKATDLDGDGTTEVVAAIDGVWNRVSTWRTDGTPLSNVNFPPGERPLHRNLPGVDVGDVTGDGAKEIVVATDGHVLVALTHEGARLWSRRLAQTPTLVAVVSAAPERAGVVVVGDVSGAILMFDGDGRLMRQGRMDGRPTHAVLLERGDAAPLVVIGTDAGHLAGFAP